MSTTFDAPINWSVLENQPAAKPATFDYSLPDGEYKMEIVKIELKTAPDMRFAYYNVGFKVIDHPKLNDRLIFIKFYTIHSDYPTMVAKDTKTLSDLSFACAGKRVDYANELYGCKCYLQLIQKPGNQKPDGTFYSPSNKIVGIKSLLGTPSKQGLPEMNTKNTKKVASFDIDDDPILF